MAATLRTQMESEGLRMLDPAAGVDLLAELLRGGHAQLAVLPVRWEQYAAKFPQAARHGLLHHLMPPAATPTPSAARPQSRHALEDLVAQQVGAVLGHPSQSVPRQVGFADLGLDSLTSIELRARLQKALGCRLSTTATFDHPTVGALTDHLAALQALAPEPMPADDLDRLGPDELAVLLARELQSLEEERV
jgi:myxalamid-type polyketide synthase MxaB